MTGIPVTRCRVCQRTDFVPILDLGMTPFADDFLTDARLDGPELHFPLKVLMCVQCRLVQLSYVAPREMLYQTDYPYLSSTTETGVRHYLDMACAIVERFCLEPDDLAVDIGSNVGVLVGGFQRMGLRAVGVEPAPKIAELAIKNGHGTINDFFSAKLAASVVETYGRASVVTGTNVVAHIDDLHDLMVGVRALLEPGGVFVFEAPYLSDLLDQCAYDTIYHEHLSYLAVRPVQAWCQMHEMEVFDVEPKIIHGGTLRYFISRRGDYSISDAVDLYEDAEDVTCGIEALRMFERLVKLRRMQLAGLLYDLKREGKRIAAVSAPAKGMTLLNYCGIGQHVLDFVTEKAPLKIGKYTPGTHIPVVPDEELLRLQPDYALLLAWNFADEIITNLRGYKGKFIVPIPTPHIVAEQAAA